MINGIRWMLTEAPWAWRHDNTTFIPRRTTLASTQYRYAIGFVAPTAIQSQAASRDMETERSVDLGLTPSRRLHGVNPSFLHPRRADTNGRPPNQQQP